MDKKKLNELKTIFSKNDSLLIMIRPDPDSISSAMAMERLCRPWVASSMIVHAGPIKRMENRAMLKRLKIKLANIKSVNLTDYTRVALLDAQPDHFDDKDLPQVDIIIDHHATDQGYPAPFKDIRPHYGATATIMSEYLDAAKITPYPRLATAMCFGIKTDTRNFERDTIRKDAEAFGKLFTHAQPKVLMDIQKWEIPIKGVDTLKQALDRFIIKEKILSVFIEPVDNPDIAVMVTDILNSIEGSLICVVGFIQNNRLLIVLRKSGTKYHVGRLAQAAFPEADRAGGHPSAARADIPLEKIPDMPSPESKDITRYIHARIAGAKRSASAQKT